jgi:hypothetical protein
MTGGRRDLIHGDTFSTIYEAYRPRSAPQSIARLIVHGLGLQCMHMIVVMPMHGFLQE